MLRNVWENSPFARCPLTAEAGELRHVNGRLWEIEDQIRGKEARQEFDQEFITLARSVYRTNDRRAALKRRINEKAGSAYVEEKSYRFCF